MANQEHVAVLKQGVDVWNKWRRDHPDIQPDLSFGVFIRTDLSRANFKSARLHRATFTGDAPLGNDFLMGDFLMTDESLCNIDLSGADLQSVYLDRTILDEADFSHATVAQNIFRNIDLRPLKGLDNIDFILPSSIDIDTILSSQGNIPGIFLQGVGVPNSIITYARSLVGKPIDYYSCFISYSSKDQDFVERLYTDLQSKGIRCWYAPEDLNIGEEFRSRIDESIRLYDKLMVILSQHSIDSSWVEFEVKKALKKEQDQGKLVLFPIKLDETVMETPEAWAADIRKKRHIGDFIKWKEHDAYQQAFARLLRDLKAEE